MPHVIVKLWPGKSEHQKNRLAEVGYGLQKAWIQHVNGNLNRRR